MTGMCFSLPLASHLADADVGDRYIAGDAVAFRTEINYF